MARTYWGTILDKHSCSHFVEVLLSVLEDSISGVMESEEAPACSPRSVNYAFSVTRGEKISQVEIVVTPEFTESDTTKFDLLVEAFVSGPLNSEIRTIIADTVGMLANEKYSGTLNIKLRVARVVQLSLR